MKLLHYKNGNNICLAFKTENGVFDAAKINELCGKKLPVTLAEVMEKKAAKEIEAALADIDAAVLAKAAVDESAIEFAPAVPNPGKILCIGLNYYAHGSEIKMNIPKTPTLFSKFNTALAAHNEAVYLPEKAERFDYEAELVIVIGEKCKNVSREDALSKVFGYTAGNDFSARDLQMLTGQWLIGKSCDGFAPVGPYIVPAEGIDPQKLDIACRVNGVTVQSSNTENMIFDCAEIVSYISQYMTLQAGDIIFTGTPSGVILGKPEEERVWLKAGDEVEIIIEGIGTLKNKLC
ncbi:MAG: fumarylacetoacetate hydrolase family protein [Oscillospiraceae bacterium]|nr:fumarylacetoacetate hydrolase family protein [Oscillospiraceae bacterium]